MYLYNANISSKCYNIIRLHNITFFQKVFIMDEIWKDVNGYEGLYQVSNYGRIKSIKYTNHKGKKPIILKQSKSNSGYYHVQIYKNRISSTRTVHSLVAKAFIPNPLCKSEINHIDGDKANNTVSNLEWVTRSENIRHSFNIGTHVPPMTGRHDLNKRPRPIAQYDKNGNFIRAWKSISEASKSIDGKNHSTGIYCCATGRHKSANGYMWRYISSDGSYPQSIEPYSVNTSQCNV